MGRVWLLALAILLVGLLDEREAGLAAALLALALVTAPPRRLRSPTHLLDPEADGTAPMSTGKKLAVVFGGYALLLIAIGLIFGSDGKNDEFQPQNEFKLDSWIGINIGGIDLSSTRRCSTSSSPRSSPARRWSGSRSACRRSPNKTQMAVEVIYDLVRGQITQRQPRREDGGEVVPVPGHALLLHPLLEHHRPDPAADQHRASDQHLRRRRPSFALYAATANISIPLVLTLVVWIGYQTEGIRRHGFFKYLKTWLPAGLEDMPVRLQGASSS